MKTWNRMLGIGILVILLTAVCANGFLNIQKKRPQDRFFQVEINRLMQEIRQGDYEETPSKDYRLIKHVERILADTGGRERELFLTGTDMEYQIRYDGGYLYRFDYMQEAESAYRTIQITLNLILLFCLAGLIMLMLYIKVKILKPFHQIQDMPFELSKGNLVCDVKEEKNKFFGKFIWGISLLRDNIEESRRQQMQLQKEKKTLILSLSHDVKTPLSAISLYAKALSMKLYDSEEKEREIAESIGDKAVEIETYINQIIQASREDILFLQVEPGECYVKDLLENLQKFYEEKLSLTGTRFEVAPYENCLLSANRDRSVEVLQNLMENGIKYGDGEEIQIRTGQEEDCFLITVVNSGCTLAGSELPHIFESFWRGSNAGRKPGSGMGLAICKNIMHQMEGEIYASIQEGNMLVTCVFCKA